MARTKQTARQSTGGRAPTTQAPGVVPTTRAGLQALKVPQLKAILKSRGLKVGGKKAELIDRILGVATPPTVPAPATAPAQTIARTNRLSGMVIAITGTLWTPRDDIQRLIEANGGRFAKSITRAVTHLVAKDPTAGTTKLNKAREQGIQVVGEDFLRQLVRGAPSPVVSPAPIPVVSPAPIPVVSPAPTPGTILPQPMTGLPTMAPVSPAPTIGMPELPVMPTVGVPTALSPVVSTPALSPMVPTPALSPMVPLGPMPITQRAQIGPLRGVLGIIELPEGPTVRSPIIIRSPVPSPAPTAEPLTPIVGVPLAPTVTGFPALTPGVPSPVEYNRYSQAELITLVQNLYGVSLATMTKPEIIQWIQMRETMGQRPTAVVGVGPQAGALSPVVTAATQLPVLPALPTAVTTTATTGAVQPILPGPAITPLSPMAQLPPITSPIPAAVTVSPLRVGVMEHEAIIVHGAALYLDAVRRDRPAITSHVLLPPTVGPFRTVVTSPPTSPVQLPPMPVISVPPIRPAVTSPMATLPPVPTIAIPPAAVVQTQVGVQLPPIVQVPVPTPIPVPTALPPIPPIGIRASVSPQPMVQFPPTTGITAPAPVIAGGLDLPTELPPITAPARTFGVGTGLGVTTGLGITMPVVPTVVPTQSIRLPSPTPTGIPAPVPLPAGTLPPTVPPPQPKVGPGGLPIRTDLATLNQLRSEINTAVNINPKAVFQQKIRAPRPVGVIGARTITLAPLPAVTLAPIPPLVPIPPGAPQPIITAQQTVPTRPLGEICLSVRNQLIIILGIDEARLNTLTISVVNAAAADPNFYRGLGPEEANLLQKAFGGWLEQMRANPGYDPLMSCENLVMLQAVAPQQVVPTTLPTVPLPAVTLPPATTVPPLAVPAPIPTVPIPAVPALPQPMIPIPTTTPMIGLPPLPAISVSPGAPVVQLVPGQPPQPPQAVQPTTVPPTGFQPLRPLPQIITSPAPQPAVALPGVQLPTVTLPTLGLGRAPLPTAALPTVRTRAKAPHSQKIHLPKIKAIAAVPAPRPSGIPGISQIRLPTVQTVMQPIALTSPAAAPQHQRTGLAVAYTPKQQVVENIMQIDPKRLNPRRARKDDNSYTVRQLRTIAGSINLPKSGNKKELVDRIKAAILKVNPNAFNQ